MHELAMANWTANIPVFLIQPIHFVATRSSLTANRSNKTGLRSKNTPVMQGNVWQQNLKRIRS